MKMIISHEFAILIDNFWLWLGNFHLLTYFRVENKQKPTKLSFDVVEILHIGYLILCSITSTHWKIFSYQNANALLSQ